MSTIENMSFLKDLNKKIVRWSSLQGKPPAGKSVFAVTEFTNVRLSKHEFKRLLDVIEEELLVVLPNTHTEKGFIGYMLIDTDANVIMEFSQQNIPEGFSMEKLFRQICQSTHNQELLRWLADEGTLAATIPKTFEECCSCGTGKRSAIVSKKFPGNTGVFLG